MPLLTANLGFPRIGPHRELKKALESFWAGRSSEADLLAAGKALRAAGWARQKQAGIDILPSNDFSFYDQVLDWTVLLGAIPDRYRPLGAADSLAVYFAMARGHGAGAGDSSCAHQHGAASVPALEMTKWFDTNYHYMVPEVGPEQRFQLVGLKPLREFEEGKALGHHSRPVLLGPVTWLSLAKSPVPGFDPLTLLPRLLPVYADLLRRLKEAGADWVQVDEPILVLDLNEQTRAALGTTYRELAAAGPQLMLASYFGALGDNLDLALSLPVAGLHLDLVRGAAQLDRVLERAPADLVLSLGVVNGRNVWKADFDSILARLKPVLARHPALQLAPSCSLLHVPVDLAAETALDPAVRSWLSFAAQKLDELAVLKRGLAEGEGAIAAELADNRAALHSRRTSALVNDPAVRQRLASVTPASLQRSHSFAERIVHQHQRLSLPLLPTTTIGSFPQTDEVRKARAAHGKGALSDEAYLHFLQEETRRTIRWQEELGLDVLVHGEFERNDMVQYFGEQLSGFAFTRAGWVQSYGSRCVRPPILYGDVARPQPMTVSWWAFAQGCSEKPVKGMLTGPVTILKWSFVRDDQPRADSCRQIALAIRDEVADLEAAGARIIQIDEAALREGLPLRRGDWEAYLSWAVECFRLASSSVRDETQIHTHMCYSEFNDIIAAIAAMDADVISIESARSNMELLDAFAGFHYPNEIGPGVYDIHSPRVPPQAEMEALIRQALARVPARQLWVNPDCGLKTRGWAEVEPALSNLVAAARAVRTSLG